MSPESTEKIASTVGEVTIRLLEEIGVDTIFGIPGEHTLEFYRGLARSSIHHVSPRHEQGAGFMADGYARVTGRPGVCLLVGGPGLTNAATAIAGAYHDSQPMLVISSQASDEAGGCSGLLHELPDQQALMATITKDSFVATSGEEVADAIALAWEVFESQRPRPIHIGIPTSVLRTSAEGVSLARRTSHRPVPSDAQVAHAARMLAEADHPMILLGGGAADARDSVISVAERVGAPVAMTINGKGTVPEDHPLCLGTTLALELVIHELEEADVVLAVGTEFAEIDFYYTRRPDFRGSLIRVDIDSNELVRCRHASLPLCGDARLTLGAIHDALRDKTPARSQLGAARALDIRSRFSWWSDVERWRPILDAVFNVLPRDTIVTADSNEIAYLANHYAPGWLPRSWLAPGGFGTLGPSVPMAIGAQVGAPSRPVLAIVGDGGFLFTMQELGTAVDLGLPLVVLLWNNRGYGAIRDAMAVHKISPIGTEVTAHDFELIARGLGCRFHLVAAWRSARRSLTGCSNIVRIMQRR